VIIYKGDYLEEYLLGIVKNDPQGKMEDVMVKPASELIIEIMEVYAGLLNEGEDEKASDYLFHSISTNILLILQLIEMNRVLSTKIEEYERGGMDK
jgi:hypothetical protein